MTEVVGSLASRVTPGPQSPKLLAGTGKDDTHLIIVATSDRGLAGAFNTNIVRAARRKADELIGAGQDGAVLHRRPQGPPGAAAASIRKQIIAQYDTSEMKAPTYADAQAIAKDIVDRYMTDGIDVVHLAYANFRSTLVQEPTVEQIIPVPPPPTAEDATGRHRSPRSNMSPTRRRSSPTCCRATSRSRSIARCSRTRPASTARR